MTVNEANAKGTFQYGHRKESFINYKNGGGNKWDSIFVPLLQIHHAGHMVTPVYFDYPYSENQKLLEERLTSLDLKAF